MEQYVRRTIEGESAGLFKAEKVVDILRTFETPESRLAALKQLIGVDDQAARRVYGKIEASSLVTRESPDPCVNVQVSRWANHID
jgi:hypothetical protein